MDKYSDDVKILKIDDREFYIIGTAHISRVSANLVDEVIRNESPDCICLELDEKRFISLKNAKKWENLNLKEVRRERGWLVEYLRDTETEIKKGNDYYGEARVHSQVDRNIEPR